MTRIDAHHFVEKSAGVKSCCSNTGFGAGGVGHLVFRNVFTGTEGVFDFVAVVTLLLGAADGLDLG